MPDHKDYLGDKFRLIERAREDTYFRQLDEELIAKMREQAATEAEPLEETVSPEPVFTSIFVPVDFSSYSKRALLTAAEVAERFGSSIIVLHVIDREVEMQILNQQLGYPGWPLSRPYSGEPSEPSDEEIETLIIDHREQAYEALQTFLPPQLAHHPTRPSKDRAESGRRPSFRAHCRDCCA